MRHTIKVTLIDGTWLNVNRRCLEIVGYPREELLQLTFGQITHAADWALVRELLRGERTTYSMEKRYITKQGRVVWANLTVSLVRKADGHPDYFISVIEDISSRKRLETERDELIAQLEERVRQRTAELERLSPTDPLTGIANRRSFDQYLEMEWDRAVRTQQPLSLVLIDIDCLKGLNDSVGHTAGDEALRTLAHCLRKAGQRTSDVAARYGGDEFVLILPDTSREGAAQIANRLEAMVHSLAIANPGSSLSQMMTVSQGIATASPDSKGTWSSLVMEADRALYVAKQNGRNRIAVSKAAMSGAAPILKID